VRPGTLPKGAAACRSTSGVPGTAIFPRRSAPPAPGTAQPFARRYDSVHNRLFSGLAFPASPVRRQIVRLESSRWSDSSRPGRIGPLQPLGERAPHVGARAGRRPAVSRPSPRHAADLQPEQRHRRAAHTDRGCVRRATLDNVESPTAGARPTSCRSTRCSSGRRGRHHPANYQQIRGLTAAWGCREGGAPSRGSAVGPRSGRNRDSAGPARR